MEVVKQKDKFEVTNIDQLTLDSLNRTSKHGSLLPDTVRCIVTGPSNCGKTNIVFNLLTSKNGLKFNNIYVFSKSLQQPKYLLLEKIISEVPEVGFYKFTENDDVLHPNEAKPFSLFIFDDVSCEKQDNIRNYFAMGRHNTIDAVYIGQTYSKIPKQLIRDNANLLVIFKQDETNLKHLHSDHVNTDMTFETFKKMCSQAWNTKYGFAVIDKDKELNDGRFRIGFDQYVIFHQV